MAELKLVLIAFVLTPIFDFIWINYLVAKFYTSQMGPLARLNSAGKFDPILWPAGIVYVLIALGIVFFVLPRAGDNPSTGCLLFWGGLYGLILYGLYDFTNLSIVSGWPMAMSFVDMIWGTFLCACLTLICAQVRPYL